MNAHTHLVPLQGHEVALDVGDVDEVLLARLATEEAVAPGAAKVLDGAPAAVVLDPAADAVRPVPLGHDDVGEDEAVAVDVLQEVASLCIKA